ncbi:hypothetical protein ScPMuIL_016637 [Solemya velum]
MNMASLLKSFTSLICILLTCLQTIGSTEHENPPRIAIIGAGIGGTSAAYFLREHFGPDVKIDVFEKRSVGGRAATILFNDEQYEAGASIIHPRNMYMVNFTKLFGLEPLGGAESGKLGIFDGKDMVFSTSDWGVVTMAKMVWRYGWDVFSIRSYINDHLFTEFLKIYDIQSLGYSFTTVADLLLAMNETFVELTKKSIDDVLKDAGFSERFINEFVMGALRMNYGQKLGLPAFVGSVSLAAAGESGLWSVKGGNKLVPQKLLESSKATLIEATVTKVTFQDDVGPMYEVEYAKNSDGKDAGPNRREYDVVIIATPLHDKVTDIKFEEFPKPIHNFPQPFHTTVATFVEAKPNISYFGYSEVCHFPDVVFTCDKDLYFNSIGKHHPVEGTSETESENKNSIYKIFSNAVPTVQQIDNLFADKNDLRIVEWLAYPQYNIGDELPPFVLHDQLYYINGIELAASALEMSAIGAKNIANLIVNHWTGNMDKIDEFSWRDESLKTDKTEL